MANIRRKGPRRYEARVKRKGVEKSRSFTTRADANEWAARTEQLAIQGRYGLEEQNNTLTLSEALRDYKREVSSHKGNANSEFYMVDRLEADFPELCAKPLGQIRTEHLRQWRKAMLQRLAPATFNRYRALLHHLFNVAATDWGLEALDNPVSKLRRAVEPPGRDRRLNDHEVNELVTTAVELLQLDEPICEMPEIISFALLTGMRAGEIRLLQWHMVDLRQGIIRLRGADTKSRKARLVPLFPGASDILQARQRSRKQIHGPVFPNASRDNKAISKDFMRIRKVAGMENVRFHDLRHEFTSRKVEDGWGLLKVQQLTGHSTATMVKRYAHLDSTSLAAEIRQMPDGPLAAIRHQHSVSQGPAEQESS